MNVNPILMTIGQTLGIPAYPDTLNPIHSGDQLPDTYLVWYYTDEITTKTAGDQDIAEEADLAVHLFTKGDPMAIKTQLKQELRDAGFNITSSPHMYEPDTRYTHVIVYCWTWDTI